MSGRLTARGPRIVLVNGIIDEGPDAARSAGHHKADRDYQQRELELLQLVDPEVMHIGDAHLHPGCLDTCSAGDFSTNVNNVRESWTQEMVFAIATASNSSRGQRSPGLYRGGLKFTFYYLGKGGGYRYRQFEPEIIKGEPLRVAPQLRLFAEAAPVRTRLDFENLRRLAAYRVMVTDLTLDGQQPRPCIVMCHKSQGFKTVLAFTSDPNCCPDVYVEADSELTQYRSEFVDGGWNRHVWFTAIVLELEREMAARLAGAGRDSTQAAASGRPALAGDKSFSGIEELTPWAIFTP